MRRKPLEIKGIQTVCLYFFLFHLKFQVGWCHNIFKCKEEGSERRSGLKCIWLVCNSYNSISKIKKTNKPNNNWAEVWTDIFIKKKYTWPQAHEKMLNNVNQRNGSPVHNEISPHTCPGYHQNSMASRCLLEYGEKGTLLHCWWECKLV